MQQELVYPPAPARNNLEEMLSKRREGVDVVEWR
jgi:hypothetical protein